MKTTFLFGFPRCGSLALSIILSNSRCMAHHEGYDYDVVVGPEKNWNETYAGRLHNIAFQKNRNYVCCDISCSVSLFKAYVNSPKYCGGAQILHIDSPVPKPSKGHSQQSVSEYCGHLRNAHLELSTYAAKLGMPQFVVRKEGRHFLQSQIIDMAKFCGAVPDNEPEMQRMIYLGEACDLVQNSKYMLDKAESIMALEPKPRLPDSNSTIDTFQN